MIIDNFGQISKLLKFEDKDDFYFLQIIQRKKDGNDVPSANNGYRTIRTYYIRSLEDLDRRRPAIIQLCEQNNARAYINLNVRNAKEVALTAAKAYIDLVREDRCDQGYRIYDHVCGKTPKQTNEKLWIVDVDTKDVKKIGKVVELICRCRSAFPIDGMIGQATRFDNLVATIPAPHGMHIVTHRFDVMWFKNFLRSECERMFSDEEIAEICEIKRDNPTILFFNLCEE